MNFAPPWTDRVPAFLAIDSPSRVAALEAIRVRYGTSHDLFAVIVCQCPASRKRYYSFLDRYYLIEAGMHDEHARRKAVVYSRIKVLREKVVKRQSTAAPGGECLRLAEEIIDAQKSYADWQEVVMDCMCIDRASGTMLEEGPIVREVDEQVLGVLADFLNAVPFDRVNRMIDTMLAAKRKRDEKKS